MKLKNTLLFGFIFMVLYVIMIIFVSFYTFSFGPSKTNIFLDILKFFTRFPFNVGGEKTSGKMFMLLLFVNGLIWGIVFYGILFFLRKLLIKK